MTITLQAHSLYLILNIEGLQNKGAVKAQEEKMKFEKEGNKYHLPLKNNGFRHVTVTLNKLYQYFCDIVSLYLLKVFTSINDISDTTKLLCHYHIQQSHLFQMTSRWP